MVDAVWLDRCLRKILWGGEAQDTLHETPLVPGPSFVRHHRDDLPSPLVDSIRVSREGVPIEFRVRPIRFQKSDLDQTRPDRRESFAHDRLSISGVETDLHDPILGSDLEILAAAADENSRSGHRRHHQETRECTRVPPHHAARLVAKSRR